jgi:hypothetical protein
MRLAEWLGSRDPGFLVAGFATFASPIATPSSWPYQDHRTAEYLYLCEWSVSRQRLQSLTADLPRIMLIDVMICSDRFTNATINTYQSGVIFPDASLSRSLRNYRSASPSSYGVCWLASTVG